MNLDILISHVGKPDSIEKSESGITYIDWDFMKEKELYFLVTVNNETGKYYAIVKKSNRLDYVDGNIEYIENDIENIKKLIV